jgi:AMP nucleosidase
VQVALEAAVAEITQLKGYELKRIMRTGTVASTDNRNWELLPFHHKDSTPERRFSQSRAIALDMEAPPSPPTASASACRTGRCCA